MSAPDRKVPAWAEPPGTQPGVGLTPRPAFRPPLLIGIAAVAVAGALSLLYLLQDDTKPPLEPLPAVDAVPTAELDEAEPLDPMIIELPTTRRARALTDLGEDDLDSRRWSRARRKFLRALSLNPEHARAHRGLGIAAARLKRYTEARAAYTRYIELAPGADDAPDVRALLGM